MTTKNRQLLLGDVPEATFQRDVIRYAELRGWLWNHNPDSRKSTPGLPDLILVRARPASRDRRIIFAELKSQGGNLRTKQREWLTQLGMVATMTDGHVECHIWQPADMERIFEVLA